MLQISSLFAFLSLMKTLETDWLIIRPFTENDFDFLHKLHSDLDVMRYTLGRVRTVKESEEYLKNSLNLHKTEQLGQMLVFSKEHDRAIGRCGFSKFYKTIFEGTEYYDFDNQDALPQKSEISQILELGYTFEKAAWGKGYASEAAAAQRDHGFRHKNLKIVTSLIMSGNIGSQKVSSKIGFKECGTCISHGSVSLKFQMTHDEWSELYG
jgi:RimJ/RimL family protein N-acetyltransferase